LQLRHRRESHHSRHGRAPADPQEGCGTLWLLLALLTAATAWFLRGERVQPDMRRFVFAFGVFAVATTILYAYIATRTGALTRLPFSGHLWRVGVLAVIGAMFSAALMQLTSTRKASDPLDH
jgi:hypothetical protein